MIKNTYIARASDGLILCETYDSVTDSQGKWNNSVDEVDWLFVFSWEDEA